MRGGYTLIMGFSLVYLNSDVFDQLTWFMGFFALTVTFVCIMILQRREKHYGNPFYNAFQSRNAYGGLLVVFNILSLIWYGDFVGEIVGVKTITAR